MKIRVLSLFDGISVGMLALKRAGFDVEKYYASEIKTKGLSKNEAEDVIGDAWTADMIAHFFGYLKRDMEKKQEETK